MQNKGVQHATLFLPYTRPLALPLLPPTGRPPHSRRPVISLLSASPLPPWPLLLLLRLLPGLLQSQLLPPQVVHVTYRPPLTLYEGDRVGHTPVEVTHCLTLQLSARCMHPQVAPP